MKLKTIDLFSGIGGLALSLHPFCESLAYCDIMPESRAILSANMNKGHIDRAPILSDVRSFIKDCNNQSLIKDRVDLVVGGFPCVGFSLGGKKNGFDNEHSRLFFDMLEIVDQYQPNMVFMENAPDILRKGMNDICSSYSQRNYDLYWTQLSASTVGAPHKRKRWFCIAIKRDYTFLPEFLVECQQEMTKIENDMLWLQEPVRMVITKSKLVKRSYSKRCAVLGNAVVPMCARYAFCHLIKNCYGKGLGSTSFLDTHTLLPTHGCLIGVEGNVMECPMPAISKKRNFGIVIGPKMYTSPLKMSKHVTRDLVTNSVTKSHWASPRYSVTGISRILTTRSIFDLPTQIRFESSTPDDVREGTINPQFLEWMMGYPQDWTTFDS